MKGLDPKGATPLYIQLTNEIQRLIHEGIWKHGNQIMSEQSLCETYNVSRVTVRKALDLLVDKKILFRRQGKGTYVSYPEFLETPYIREQSFTASEIYGKAVPYTHILHKSTTIVTEKLKESFKMEHPVGEEMISIVRIRYLDDDPVIFETDYFPMQFQAILDLDLENRSLYGLLHERMGIVSLNVREYFRIKTAAPQIAESLKVPVGHPLLRVAQTVLGSKQQVIYYNEQLIKTESYEYKVESYDNS